MKNELIEAIRKQAAAEERAKIVAYLKQDWQEDDGWGQWFGERIEEWEEGFGHD